MNTLPLNFKLLAAGLVLVVVGYILLGQGPVNNPLSTSVAPVVLVIAYCVIIPLSIVTGKPGDAGAGDKGKKKGV
jgi:hypothetical protein